MIGDDLFCAQIISARHLPLNKQKILKEYFLFTLQCGPLMLENVNNICISRQNCGNFLSCLKTYPSGLSN